MKRLKVLFAGLISVAVMLCAMLTGCVCDTSLDIFKDDYIEWYSEDGSVCITSTVSSDYAYGYFTVNGIQVRAYFSLTYTSSLEIAFQYSDDLNVVTDDYENYVSDTGICYGYIVGYRSGDVFHVTEFVVGNTNLDTFDMYSRYVDPTSIDARNFGCVWKSEGDLITIWDGLGWYLDEQFGTVVANGVKYSIFFVWCEGGRFEIYNDEYKLENRILLADGTYSNVGEHLTLYFEEDTAFGLSGQTVELAACL